MELQTRWILQEFQRTRTSQFHGQNRQFGSHLQRDMGIRQRQFNFISSRDFEFGNEQNFQRIHFDPGIGTTFGVQDKCIAKSSFLKHAKLSRHSESLSRSQFIGQ